MTDLNRLSQKYIHILDHFTVESPETLENYLRKDSYKNMHNILKASVLFSVQYAISEFPDFNIQMFSLDKKEAIPYVMNLVYIQVSNNLERISYIDLDLECNIILTLNTIVAAVSYQ